MKKLLMALTSVILCMTMLIGAPAQLVASAADGGKKYISEVKVGMGETSDEASKELKSGGYTILTDDKGDYADLNKDAGTSSAMKKGPNQKIVYLGYKTTNDVDDAVTDLAVMNMNGGYSYQEYEKLMDDHMNTEIKPFVQRFIATLAEYRKNLEKPKDSLNYKRADYYRTLLNKFTDDDTKGQPLGDLLVNKTKFEMGDAAYNALSDSEKNNHCDILTLLMQGNGEAVQLVETMLTKASDSRNTTWLERFVQTDLDTMRERVEDENPSFTPSEIDAALDKQYNDDAKRILDKWNAFTDILANYDEAVDKADEVIEDSKDDVKDAGSLNNNSSAEEVQEVVEDAYKAESNLVKGSMAAEDIVVHDYLDAVEYGDGTLLDFFERDKSEFDDKDSIRELYPIVKALTAGQIAGLDFLSIKDMFLMAITDENGFKEVKSDKISASIYQDVNREIYDRGGVALTDDALRAQASAQETEPTFELSGLGIALWSCTAVMGAAVLGSAIGWAKASSDLSKAQQALDLTKDRLSQLKDRLSQLSKLQSAQWGARDALDHYNTLKIRFVDGKFIQDKVINVEYQATLTKNLKEAEDATKKFLNESGVGSEQDLIKQKDSFNEAVKKASLKSNICKYLTAGFTVVMAILAGYSIYTTIKELIDFYCIKFAPIPKYIVERTDITAKNKKGKETMIRNQSAYYKVVPCNRTEGDSSVEKENYKILGDRNDLNGDVGQEWLALYSVKYENGTPILADSLKLKMGKAEAIEGGYEKGIHMFGSGSVFNLTHYPYCYKDPYDGTYVYFKTDTVSVKEQTAAGSLFSGGSLAIGAVAGLLVGSAFTLLLSFSIRKRRETKPV
ncbi:MAG: hypothetical protein IJ903_04915 [Ruminococcus sp.]|nr:hypothetical protein [Ruminococcus sp.]